MAKLKQPTDEDTALPKEAAEETTAANPEPVRASEEPAAKKEKKNDPETQPDELVLGVLRAFPGYATLYVDRHGGAFPPDTPAGIRGGAALYRNPFHKP